MKRIFALALCLLLLCGCSAAPEMSTQIPETTGATEPALPDLVASGRIWDAEGTLTEVPLTIPEAWKYTSSKGFGELLLLYGCDAHLTDTIRMDLLLVDPMTGQVLAENHLTVSGYLTPQILDGQIFICDARSGMIYELNNELALIGQWQVDPQDGYWFMGTDNTLYQFNESKLAARNLVTGETYPVIPGNPDIYATSDPGKTLCIEYYHPDTGLSTPALLDLHTGTLIEAPVSERLSNIGFQNGIWLCNLASSVGTYYLGSEGALNRVYLEESSLCLLEEGYLMESTLDTNRLNLYQIDGSFVASCQLSETGSYYLRTDPIWNEALGGYFLMANSYDGDTRLLFWNLSKTAPGEDLTPEPIPAPSEAMLQLRARADELETRYGVTIWIGEECPTEFYDFRGCTITDWEEITQELDSMEIALESYPEGFFRQLKFGPIHGIQIYLIQQLEPTSEGWLGGSYSAFAQHSGDHYAVVCDILQTNEYTYFHEFSHVIDQYLEANSWNREDALYSEAEWASLNPDTFQYTWYYNGDFSWFDYSYHSNWFIDSYSTTFPTEDRARVMEYAMMEHCYWYFQEGSGLYNKLDYYARCIRDAFDTTGWPEVTVWEQFLNR